MTVATYAAPNQRDVDGWSKALMFATRLAEVVNQTEFVPTALRGRPEAVAATILYGLEIGVTPMQALAGIHIVEGRPAPSSELMRALILAAGHRITVHEATGQRARVTGQRKGAHDSERLTIEWTFDQARAAGLAGRPNWRNYPRAMLVARATGDLARILFPDVVKGLGYVAEETATDTEVAAWGPPEVEAKPPPVVSRKVRKTAAKAEPVPTPPAPPMPGVEDVQLPPMSEEEAKAAEAVETDTWLTDEEAEAKWRASLEEPRGPETSVADTALEDLPLPPENQLHGPVETAAPGLPELEPERAAPEPPTPGGGPQLIGTGQLRALHTLLSEELGTASTSEERQGLVAAILGKPVESTKALTRHDAQRLFRMFEAFKTGEAGWEFTEGGKGFSVFDFREAPPEDDAP